MSTYDLERDLIHPASEIVGKLRDALATIGVFVALQTSPSLRQQTDSRLMYGLAWLLPTMMSLSSVSRCP